MLHCLTYTEGSIRRAIGFTGRQLSMCHGMQVQGCPTTSDRHGCLLYDGLIVSKHDPVTFDQYVKEAEFGA
jgi:hypothetical protein